ncbi:hypothetical protein ABBQ38_007765 [Trebouxia sp. C0009 RCD-2024]
MAALTMPITARATPITQVRSNRTSAFRSGLAPKRASVVVRVKGIDEPNDNDNTWENAQNDDKKGTAAGARQWPPKPITEHGQPKPEDDPANYEDGKRVRGPPEEEIQKRRAEGRKNSPFLEEGGKPGGGTQQGGGGEGSGA